MRPPLLDLVRRGGFPSLRAGSWRGHAILPPLRETPPVARVALIAGAGGSIPAG